jgi:hypothetical protein
MAYSPLSFVVSFIDQRKNAMRALDTARPHRYRSYHLPDRKLAMRYHLSRQSEPVFLNVYGAQESIPRNEFRQPM